MLEINNVVKKFKKLKAINDTTLKFEEKGLIALLGPSGCGKTTLLNTIGGLDKINKGKIFVDGQKVSSRMTYKVDKIRNKSIGYIFQDYKLIENISVYDNVALVLKMLGIKKKEEIKERVEYVLDKVGMLRYKRRPAGMLSGGEKQRVAIARALVKNPKVLLCDEPTGNLDSKNSLEIMKIIKSISKERLVVLVTHEQNLAKFYASRIIRIEDGKVIEDYANDEVEELDYELESTIYLKDMHRKDKISDGKYNINLYMNKDEDINIDIVLKNGNIYIRNNNYENIEVVDEDTSIEFIDDHYKKIGKSEIDAYHFDTEKLDNSSKKLKYSSILNPISLVTKGFSKVFDFPLMKKILLLGFVAAGGTIMVSSSLYLATQRIDERDYIEYNKNYIHVETKKIIPEEYFSYTNLDFIDYVIPGKSKVKLNLDINLYYQTYYFMEGMEIEASLADSSKLTKKDIVVGRLPETSNEIIIDELVINRMNDNNKETLRNIGINKNKHYLGMKMKAKNREYTIVGISNTTNPSIYASRTEFLKLLINSNDFKSESNILDYEEYKDRLIIKEGRTPTNDYEVIVSIDNKETIKLNKNIPTKVNGRELYVVGYYDSPYQHSEYFTNTQTTYNEFILKSENLSFYPKDKTKTLEYLLEKNYNASVPIESAKEKYLKDRKAQTSPMIITCCILIIVSMIEIIFMVRSSFLSRIKEIGIYRAIGVKKTDIYKMFLGEIIAITTLTNVPGILFAAYCIKTLTTVPQIAGYIYYSPTLVLFVIAFNYIFNALMGLMPVFTTTRKRPAAILARYDVD